jgi:hypothetical protein
MVLTFGSALGDEEPKMLETVGNMVLTFDSLLGDEEPKMLETVGGGGTVVVGGLATKVGSPTAGILLLGAGVGRGGRSAMV